MVRNLPPTPLTLLLAISSMHPYLLMYPLLCTFTTTRGALPSLHLPYPLFSPHITSSFPLIISSLLVSQVVERQLVFDNLLGKFHPFIAYIVANEHGHYHDPLVRETALLALCRYMCVSNTLCEQVGHSPTPNILTTNTCDLPY